MAGDMRVAVIGQASFGKSVLNALADRGYTVVAALCPPDREGRPADPLKKAALELGVPVHQFPRLRDQTAIDAFRAVEPDLCAMAFVTDIVPEAILVAPSRGTIQYHPSLLPRHRGPSSINWSIIQGETRTGLTIFWPDKGLDTGPILIQKEVEIGPEDTVGSLYFDKLFPLGVEAMVEAVNMVRDGTAPRIAQDESQATYEGWCKAEDAVIDWTRPISETHNLVRGSDPSPGAGTTYEGQPVRLYRASRRDGESGRTPGEVTEVTADAFGVAVDGGTLLFRRVQPRGSGKVSAPEWAEAVGLRPGARIGT